jgi:hypothetical protein
VGQLTKKIIHAEPSESPLTYVDINGRPLVFPDTTVQPFLRALVLMAKTACKSALHFPREHNCLLELNLQENYWEEVMKNLKEESNVYGVNPFEELQAMLNDLESSAYY